MDHMYVLTCAHVVNSALGLEQKSVATPHPNAQLAISFPFSGVAKLVPATVVRWRPPDASAGGDMALLKLKDSVPNKVGYGILAAVAVGDIISQEPQTYHSLKSFFFFAAVTGFRGA